MSLYRASPRERPVAPGSPSSAGGNGHPEANPQRLPARSPGPAGASRVARMLHPGTVR